MNEKSEGEARRCARGMEGRVRITCGAPAVQGVSLILYLNFSIPSSQSTPIRNGPNNYQQKISNYLMANDWHEFSRDQHILVQKEIINIAFTLRNVRKSKKL